MTIERNLAVILIALTVAWPSLAIADDLAKASQNPIGDMISLPIERQGFSHVVKPDAGPHWSVMASVKFLFPK